MTDAERLSLLHHAMAHANQGHLAPAETLCRQVVAARPRDGAARHLLARILCRGESGDAVEAEALLRPLVEADPGNIAIRLDLGDALTAQGRIEEAIALLRQAAAAEGRGTAALSRLAGLLDRLDRRDEAVETLFDLVGRAPGEAGAFLTLGRHLIVLGRFAEALAALGQALTLKPDWPAALSEIGVVFQNIGPADIALACQRHAAAGSPDDAMVLGNLGAALRRNGRPGEAAEAFARALAIAPGNVKIALSHARALEEAGAFAAAAAAYRQCLADHPDHPVARFDRAIHLLRRGDFAEGWREYEWRRRGGVKDLVAPPYCQPEWRGEPLQGRTVLLHAEQGFGDTLQFCRFAPGAAARGGRVILAVQPPLVDLLGGLDCVAQVVARDGAPPPFDLHLPLLSLPAVLGLEDEASLGMTAPYLRPDPARVAAWRSRLAALPRPLVGVAWAGNRFHRADGLRSIAAVPLLDRLARTGVTLVSLQKDPRPGDREALAARAGRIIDLGGDLGSFADTAALAASLDLVISVDTAVLHLAAALGRPAWGLLPAAADWRWMEDRDDSPWYPTLRLFRQRRGDGGTGGDGWPPLLDRVAAALDQTFSRAAIES